MKTQEYTNRYGDKFTFTLLEDGNIKWEGNFEYCRMGMPNDYSDAYKVYLEKECSVPHDHTVSFEQFKNAIEIGDLEDYRVYIKPMHDKINMVDPSGGPYLSSGVVLMGKVIKEFKSKDYGYLILTDE